MVPDLFVWDVVITGDPRGGSGPGGVAGSESAAIDRLTEAIGEVPAGQEAWGHVTHVRVEFVTPTRGSAYRRLDRVAYVRLRGDGAAFWVIRDAASPANVEVLI